MNDGSVIIDVELNTDRARQQYQSFGSEAASNLDQSIGKSKAFNKLSQESVDFAKKAVLGIGAVTTAFAGFSIKSAGDMAAMNAQFSQVFDGINDAADKSLNKIADDTKMLPNRLKGSFTQMAAFAKTTGMDTADALKLTERATRAAADSAAFYDRSIEDTSESLQSFLKGNYENDAALGISATETTRNAAANKLYGKSFNDLNESQKQLTLLQMVEDGNKLSGALGQAAREGNGLENVFGNMKQSITDLAAAFGAPLLDPFLSIVNKLSGAMSKLADKLRENPALVSVVVGVVATLAAAFGAVWLKAAGFDSILKAIGTVLPVLTSPIFLVVAAIGALITAFVYFYKTSDTFRSKVDGMIGNLKNLLIPISEVGKAISIFGQLLKTVLSGNAIPEQMETLHKSFTNIFPESVWQSAKNFVFMLNDLKLSIKAIAGVITGSIQSFSDFEEAIFGIFPENVTRKLFEFGEGLKKLITWFKNLGSPIESASKNFDLLGIAFTVLKTVVLTLLGPIGLVIKVVGLLARVLGGGDVSRGIDMIIAGFEALSAGIQQNAPKIGTSAGQAIEGILTAIATALPGIITGGLKIVAALVSGIAGGIPSLTIAASQLIFALTGAMMILVPQIALSASAIIVAFLGALTIGLPQIIAAGGALILALLTGITEQLPTLVESVATLIITWLTALNEHMPEILQAGFTLLITFLQGIADNIGQVTQQALNIVLNFAQVILANMPTIVNAAVDLMVSFLNGLASRMPDIIASAANLITSFINGIANNLGSIINAAVNMITKFLEGIGNRISDIVDAGMDLIDKIVDGVLQAQDRLFRAAEDLIRGFADNIRNHSDDMKSAAGDLLDALASAILPDFLYENGKAIVSGFKRGLESAFEGVKNMVSGWADTIAKLKGPLSYDKKVLVKNGLSLVQGLNKGLDDGFDQTQSTVSRWAGLISDSMVGEFNSDFFNGVMDKLPSVKGLINGTLKPELRTSGQLATAGVAGTIINNTYNRQQASDSGDQVVEVHVHADIDSKELTKRIAEPVRVELNKIEERKNIIKKGRKN